jgi:hypothetical protein
MIKREDFDGKQYEEMMVAMQTDLDQYREHVNVFTTEEECEAEEQVLMASMDEVRARLATVNYELPTSVSYEEKTYTKKEVASKIIYFLNKVEVKWEHTLGMHQLVSLWKRDDLQSINYGAYDSTLRTLNTVSFKGNSEWLDILVVNEFFRSTHNEYSLDTGMLVYLHECHNVLMNRMKEINPDTVDVPDSLEE